MKPQGIVVLLMGMALCCIMPITQPLCTRRDSCVTIPGRDYCKASIAEGQYKPVCPVMEVQLGDPKYEIIYIPCCDERYNVTSRRWYFSRDAKTWKLFSTNETISFYQINKDKLGFYRCITKTGNQTVHLRAIDCRKSYNKPEVRLSRNISYVKADQHNVMFSYHVNFGCDAAARNINIIYHKDALNIRTTSVPPIVIQRCTSGRSVSRICGGNISVVAEPGAVVSITATACYNGMLQKVSRNFTIQNAVQYRLSQQNNTVASLQKTVISILSVVAFVVGLVVMAFWSKLHVAVLSEMTFVMSITDKNKSIGSATQVYICHCDEDVSSASRLQTLMTNTYTSLQVVCSDDLTGKGVFTGEIDTIKQSDVVLFIPNYSTVEKVHDNIFNSIVQHKNYFRITILDTSTPQNTSCTFTKNKLFKRLKHIDTSRDNFHSELRKRLPAYIRRRDSVDGVMGSNSCSNLISCSHDGYQSGYHIPGKHTYGFPCRHLQNCNNNRNIRIPQVLTGGNRWNLLPDILRESESDISSETNSQRSKTSSQHILKLTIGNHCPKEVTSPCSAESPDMATTNLSPEIGI